MTNKELYSLVKRLKNNDEQAFEEMYNKLWSVVYYIAYYYLNDSEGAKDITQETFIKIYNKIGDLKKEITFNAWMHKIIFNLCRSYQRKLPKVKNLDIIDVDDELIEKNIESLPAELLQYKDKQEEVLEQLAKLPIKFKTVILLYYFEEMTITDIASTLNIAVGTVHKRLVKAKSILKRELDEKSAVEQAVTTSAILITILKQDNELICTDAIKQTIYKGVKGKLSLSSTSVVGTATGTIITKVVITSVLLFTTYGGYKLIDSYKQTNDPIKQEEKVEVIDNNTLEAFVGIDNAKIVKSYKTRSKNNNHKTLIEINSQHGIKDVYYHAIEEQFLMYILYQKDMDKKTLFIGERYDSISKEWNVIYEIIDLNTKTISETEIQTWFEDHE